MAYPNEGTLVTDAREIAISETWDTQTDWEAFQSASNVVIENGILKLEETQVPDASDLHARYSFDEYSAGTTSNFQDLTGNGHEMVNGSITGVSESINTVQAGELDGADDGIYTATFSDIYPLTASIVMRVDNLNSEDDAVANFSTENMLIRHQDGSGWQLNAASNITSNDSTTGDLLFTAVFADSGALLRLNGTELVSGSTGTGRDANEVGLAFFPRIGSGYIHGAVGECLVYPYIRSSSEIDEQESYLADKWGITL